MATDEALLKETSQSGEGRAGVQDGLGALGGVNVPSFFNILRYDAKLKRVQ